MPPRSTSLRVALAALMLGISVLVGCQAFVKTDSDGPSCGAGFCRNERQRYVFVTNDVFRGDFAKGRDVRAAVASACRAEADSSANVDAHRRTWGPWLSTQTVTATTSGPSERAIQWVRLDGAVVFGDTAQVHDTNPQLQNPIGTGEVWTGTGVGGTGQFNTCQSWTELTPDAGGPIGEFGNAARVDGGWTYVSAAKCNAQKKLYCFESN